MKIIDFFQISPKEIRKRPFKIVNLEVMTYPTPSVHVIPLIVIYAAV